MPRTANDPSDDHFARPAARQRPPQRACGHRWTGSTPCTNGPAHVCWRTGPEHRTHICICEAVQIRPTSSVPFASFAS